MGFDFGAKVIIGPGELDRLGQETSRALATRSLCTKARSCYRAGADLRGGLNTGTLTVQVGSPQPINRAPVALGTFQSNDTAASGQRIDFALEAIDPEGGALTFAWSASAGTLGTPASTGNPSGSTTSQVAWTTPAGVGPFTITVVVRDPAHLEATRAFTVTGTTADVTVDQAQLASTGRRPVFTMAALDFSGNSYFVTDRSLSGSFGLTSIQRSL